MNTLAEKAVTATTQRQEMLQNGEWDWIPS